MRSGTSAGRSMLGDADSSGFDYLCAVIKAGLCRMKVFLKFCFS